MNPIEKIREQMRQRKQEQYVAYWIVMGAGGAYHLSPPGAPEEVLGWPLAA